jgi:hypothetical protein
MEGACFSAATQAAAANSAHEYTAIFNTISHPAPQFGQE